jgi:hypothetical protein
MFKGLVFQCLDQNHEVCCADLMEFLEVKALKM